MYHSLRAYAFLRVLGPELGRIRCREELELWWTIMLRFPSFDLRVWGWFVPRGD